MIQKRQIIKQNNEFKTALSNFESKNGAVFIFAFFKYATDCIIIESPLAPQIKAQSGKQTPPNKDKVFNPCVHSKSPKTKPFAILSLPKMSEKR